MAGLSEDALVAPIEILAKPLHAERRTDDFQEPRLAEPGPCPAPRPLPAAAITTSRRDLRRRGEVAARVRSTW